MTLTPQVKNMVAASCAIIIAGLTVWAETADPIPTAIAVLSAVSTWALRRPQDVV
jgi:hypothetical protein